MIVSRAGGMARLSYRLAAIMVAVLLTGVQPDASWAQTSVVRVEEDWELVVTSPDSASDAPQITCVFSPTGDVRSVYGVFVLNHQSLPDFVAGGLQLQVWLGEEPLVARKFSNNAAMTQAGEIVRWTQRIEITDGTLSFEIVDGSSSTWGTFGGQGYLKASMPTGVTSLDAYHPQVSVDNSGINFAANRVQSLVLKRVRLTMSDEQVLEDATERTIHGN